MKAIPIKEGVYWVGVIDWGLRTLHGYFAEYGSTYNAFLILDEKITLIDNVKADFTSEMIERIKSVIDPSKIEIIISNHGEPDHSGSLKEILKYVPNVKIYSSYPNGQKILNAIYGDLPIITVKNKETISIGKRTLQFIHTPMVHWPDNMVTYCIEDKILFSNDIFGQHYATSNILDYENNLCTIIDEAKKYYANIVLPYTKQAIKVMNDVKDLQIEIIATSHGVIWKQHIKEIFDLYYYLASYQKENKAVVVYDTMWGSTKLLAEVITETFRKKGIKVRLYNVNDTNISDIIAEIVDAKYLAVGSSTINSSILPTIAGFLNYLKGLAPVDMKYICFGSYGWNTKALNNLEEELELMKFERLIPTIKQYYVPAIEQLNEIENELLKHL